MNRLLALAMVLLAGSLVSLPHVSTQTHVAAYAFVMGLAGGFVIVIFFAYWSRAYGRVHLGKIQGAAQALTVVASAVGPLPGVCSEDRILRCYVLCLNVCGVSARSECVVRESTGQGAK